METKVNHAEGVRSIGHDIITPPSIKYHGSMFIH